MYQSPMPLKQGDNVAIIAPSSPISSKKAIRDSFEVLKKFKLNPVLGENVKKMRQDAWSSASVKERIEEIRWAFTDDNIQAIIVAEGGFGSIELIPFLPYDEISNSRKSFMGMSDVTAINNSILSTSNLINFSGPNIRIREDMPNDKQALNDALSLLMRNDIWGELPFKRMTNMYAQCVCDGIATGRAVGGNMTIFSGLVGTPYIPDLEGAILFFEDVYATSYDVFMSLQNMELAGIFDKVNGVVFGEFLKSPKQYSCDLSIEDVIVRFFRNKIPCICGMNFSHGETVAPIPLGVEVTMDSESCTVFFDNPFKNQ